MVLLELLTIMIEKVLFISAHGIYEIAVGSAETVADLCNLYGIPKQSFCMDIMRSDGSYEAFVGIYTKFKEINARVLRIIPDRNIDHAAIINLPIFVSPAYGKPVTEYTFRHTEETQKLLHKKLSQFECQQIVQQNITNFLAQISVTTQPIVIGYSGGGDSNSLLQGLASSEKLRKCKKICVMLQGLPEWDNRIESARELCKQYSAELIEISAEETSDLLGSYGKKNDWIDKFEQKFPEDDLEFIGTLAIKKGLLFYAKKYQAQAVITGLNAEDICAEILACISLGYSPMPFPIRLIDNINFWYPLYLTPKKIADGCFPKQARENYSDRYPSNAYGRTIFYYIAQSLEDRVPGFLTDFIKGVEKSIEQKDLSFDSTNIPQETLKKWCEMFPLVNVKTTD